MMVRRKLVSLVRLGADDGGDCPLPDQSVDVVVLLNVLEHIEDDALAIRHVHRILKPGGTAIIEVPAGPRLYDAYDRLLMHHRRYTLSGLCHVLREAGFEITRKSHLGCFLYPAFCLVKWWNQHHEGKADREQKRRVARNIGSTAHSSVMDLALRLETWLGQRISYPVGIRCLVTAKKPIPNQCGSLQTLYWTQETGPRL